jgi:mannose-1-phosphate guanylyltransferase/phosphomannomutase
MQVKAIIMAGGEGSRLRPLTCDLPKPMVNIANKPIKEHIIDLLKAYGITEIGVTLMYCLKR